MQAPVEICYAGVVVSRAQEVREGEGGEFFIKMKDPLPVGTLLGMRSADSQVTVRVAHVVESSDGAEDGMRVRPVGAQDADSTLWIPPPPAKVVPPPVSVTVADAPPAQAAPEPEPVVESKAKIAAAPIEAPTPFIVPVVQAVEPFALVESAAVPVKVPVESSGKRRKKITAVQMVIAETSAPAPTAEPAPAAPAAVESNGTPEKMEEGQVESSLAASGEPASDEAEEKTDGDLPPARPVQGSSGRRRTKRRR